MRVTQADAIFHTFRDMVRKKQVQSKRTCLKCRKEFISRTNGHRLCGDCNAENNTPCARTFNAMLDKMA